MWFHAGIEDFWWPQTNSIASPAPLSWPWHQPQRFTRDSLNETPALTPPCIPISLRSTWITLLILKLQFKHHLLAEAFPGHEEPLLHLRCSLLCSHSHKGPLPSLHPRQQLSLHQPAVPSEHLKAGTVSSTLNTAQSSLENFQNQQRPWHPSWYLVSASGAAASPDPAWGSSREAGDLEKEPKCSPENQRIRLHLDPAPH